ncbi:hypothetical protein BYT27DRAFT_7336320 [Phlegmacium glaucopus]|nr:hypothetical protein BYT27DRAFT_7336320 [Phlegmacium glaucopus]
MEILKIYRCWIVWGCNIRVVILPSISAFVFLAMWLADIGSVHIVSDQILEPKWVVWLGVACFPMSMTVHALVTGLIVWKIFKVYREVKSAESDDQTLGVSKIRTVIFVLIESGMMLFSIQLARLVVFILPATDTVNEAYDVIVGIHEMLNGITPTIIQVRVSMGLSFYDQESMIESSVGSLRFADNNPNASPETGDVDIGNRDDDIGIRLSDDIQMVDR